MKKSIALPDGVISVVVPSVDTSRPPRRRRLVVGLLLTYFLYGILLNSASLIVLHEIASYHLSHAVEGFLPKIPDATILVLSLVVATYLARLGYRCALLISLGSIFFACIAMPLLNDVPVMLSFFVLAGATFVLVKTASYTLVGFLTSDQKQHASFLCLLEAVFMAGILVGNVSIFGALSESRHSDQWLKAFYILSGIALLAFLLVKTSPLEEAATRTTPARISVKELVPTVRRVFTPFVLAFIISNLLYVLSEQSAVNWFPAYDNGVIHAPLSMTVPELMTVLVFYGWIR